MSLPIEHYAAIGDGHTAALVGHRRLAGLAVPAAVRLPRVLRRAAGRRPQRPLAGRPGRQAHRDASLRRGHRGARDDVPHRHRRDAGHRPDADRRSPRRRRTPCRGSARDGLAPAQLGGALRLRPDPPVGAPRGGRRQPGDHRDRRARQAHPHRAAPATRRRRAPRGDLRRRRGRDAGLHAHLEPVLPHGSRTPSTSTSGWRGRSTSSRPGPTPASTTGRGARRSSAAWSPCAA